MAAAGAASAGVEDVLAALRGACEDPALDRVLWEATTEGAVFGVWPPGIDEPTALAVFLTRLREVLAGHGPAGRRLRVRVAVAEGITLLGTSGFEGRAITAACRACMAPWLEGLLTRSPAADLAVAVAEHLHRDLSSAAPGGRATTTATATTADTFTDGPWVWRELREDHFPSDRLPPLHGDFGTPFGGMT